MFRLLSAFALSLVLASCSTGPVLRPMLDGYPGTITHSSATARFQIPEGWRVANDRHKGIGRCTITLDSSTSNDKRPVVRFLFGRTDPTVPATEVGQIKSYLDAMHAKEDDTVRMSKVGSIQNPQHGAIGCYYLHSTYSGHRLHAGIIDSRVLITCELVCKNAEQVSQHRPSFEGVVRSIRIKNENP